MKSVLASFKPQYCELIASGRKTVELRKTRPKLDAPFKVYMYQTKGHWIYKILEWLKLYQGKVIGEFVCEHIESLYDNILHGISNDHIRTKSCLTGKELNAYADGRELFAWHISDLVIYDEPKELSEFYKEDFEEIYSSWEDLFSIGVPTDCSVKYPPEPKKEDYVIKRPPQSWCYVEEVQE